MFIPFYLVENSWCFLEIFIKNNSYWIDWKVIYDKNNMEIKDKKIISLDFTTKSSILCLIDNKYYYFNTDDKKINNFCENFNLYSIDASRNLESLINLKKNYEEYLYPLEIEEKN